MDRVTVDVVKDLVDEYDFELIHGNTLDDPPGFGQGMRPRGCIRGLLMLHAKSGDLEAALREYRFTPDQVGRDVGLDPSYVVGLEVGYEDFDGDYNEKYAIANREEYARGIKDGTEIRKEFG